MPIPFVGPSYALATRKADVQRAVNLYLVGMETPGKAPFIMDSVPGLSVFLNLMAEVRGVLTVDRRAFAVAGATLYEILSNGTATALGTLATSTGPVGMEFGLTQLVIVDGPNGYVLTLASNTFQTITSDGFYGSTLVRFIDNYFLFIRPGTQQLYISAINDATDEDPLDFASAEGSPDNLVGLAVTHSQILLLGELTGEVWSNTGNGVFPFERDRGITLEVGCFGPHTIQRADNTIFWGGKDENGTGMVYRLDGGRAVRVSTQAVEQALQKSTDLSSATAYTYQQGGLTFYCINAPGVETTWCYEVMSGQWHERADLTAGVYAQHRIWCHCYAFGKHLGGSTDGRLYSFEREVYTNAGDPLVRERISPHNAAPGRVWQFFSGFFLDCTTGGAPQDVQPQVELSWSNDSGATWTNWTLGSLGAVGQRVARVLWTRMGRSRDRVWRVRFSGNAPFSIIDGGAL